MRNSVRFMAIMITGLASAGMGGTLRAQAVQCSPPKSQTPSSDSLSMPTCQRDYVDRLGRSLDTSARNPSDADLALAGRLCGSTSPATSIPGKIHRAHFAHCNFSTLTALDMQRRIDLIYAKIQPQTAAPPPDPCPIPPEGAPPCRRCEQDRSACLQIDSLVSAVRKLDSTLAETNRAITGAGSAIGEAVRDAIRMGPIRVEATLMPKGEVPVRLVGTPRWQKPAAFGAGGVVIGVLLGRYIGR